MLRFGITLLLFFGGTVSVFAQAGFRLSGKLRVLNPTEIRVETINGESLLSVQVPREGAFLTEVREIKPDLYILWIGNTQQAVYLTNTEVSIKGYYDEVKPENSSLSFSGIDDFLELLKWMPVEESQKKKTINPGVKGQLRGTMYSALAYLSEIEAYEPNKMLLEQITEEDRDALTVQWLADRVDSLARFAVGARAFDFNYVDPGGNMVRLSDFRGKLVLIDFWASWCGPCRHEMKSLLPIYNDLKGDDLIFISISLDKREKDWRKMLETENLPWVMLWNKEGFTIGDAPNEIQRAYGFYGIPFILLVDKEGKILERGLRGEKVREAILKARGV